MGVFEKIMKFQVEVKNFGKIKDARVDLAPFTVISGTNSSGKSFLSKALYTFFSTINKDYVTLEVKKLFNSIYSLSHYGFYSTKEPSSRIKEIYELLDEQLQVLDESINADFGRATFIEQHANNLNIASKVDLIEDTIQELQHELKNKKKYSEFLERITTSLKQIKNLKEAVKNPSKILSKKLDEEFKNNLKENFQVLTLADLISNDSKDGLIKFNIEGLGEIKIDKEAIDFNLKTDAISEFQLLHNVVFVESPIYWKLRKPLMEIQRRARNNPLFVFKQQQSELTGVPKFFYDLMELLSLDIKADDTASNFSNPIQDKINKTLSGELIISDSGEIYFKDKGCSKNINLNLTATGVTNLGIIGLLVKKNIIASGSYVFIDEPEVNLHPAWQKIMIESLYDLSLNGINVVIATHSIDMIKYIENIMQDLSDDQINKHFAVNRLSNNGVSISENLTPRESLLKIKDDLGESFYNMVLESGW